MQSSQYLSISRSRSLSFVLIRLGRLGSFTYSCRSSDEEMSVSRLLLALSMSEGASCDLRRLDRLLLELSKWSSLWDDRLVVDLREDERVGFVILSVDDADEVRQRCFRLPSSLYDPRDTWTATEHILCRDDLFSGVAKSSRIVSINFEVAFGLASFLSLIPDSFISITDCNNIIF